MNNEIIKFVNGDLQLDVTVSPNEETVWLTQKQMAELFDVKSQAITRHLKNIYNDEELFKEATCSKIEQVQMEGSRKITRKMDFYNLDAIIAVGYRVNSKNATSFRRWATSILKKYMIKNIRMIPEVPLYSVVFQYLYYSYKRLCKRYSGSSFDWILLIKEEINYKGHWNKKDWSIYEQ